MKSNTHNYAERELDILVKSATDPENRPIIEPFIPEILALCDKFGKSGQSGGSAPYAATALSQAIKKLCLQEPICPITGIAEEFGQVSGSSPMEYLGQNKRCNGLFIEKGKAYYLDAIIWKEDYGGVYHGSAILPSGEVIRSRQYVKSFPYTPKTFYVDVVKEILPEDWTQEPFIEWDYYEQKHFDATGGKLWKKEKYRNIIKDPKQLKRVWKYYDKYDL